MITHARGRRAGAGLVCGGSGTGRPTRSPRSHRQPALHASPARSLVPHPGPTLAPAGIKGGATEGDGLMTGVRTPRPDAYSLTTVDIQSCRPIYTYRLIFDNGGIECNDAWSSMPSTHTHIYIYIYIYIYICSGIGLNVEHTAGHIPPHVNPAITLLPPDTML